MSWSFSLPDAPVVVALGWTLLLSLWLTALIGLLVWGGVRAARGSSPVTRHRLAMSGLTLAAVGTVVAFVGLGPAAPSPTHVQIDHPGLVGRAVAVSSQLAAPAPTSTQGVRISAAITSLLPSRLVAWGGLVWVFASAVLGLRALGGMLVVWRMRRRATPLRSVLLRQSVECLAGRMDLRRFILLLESSEIETPVALGWWRAAILFPLDLQGHLEIEQVEAIVAHELEHLRGRDPLFAAAQVAIDAFLCLCPGARWLSTEARKTRELCCDDAAVRVCGNAAVYASALGALASLGRCGTRAPVLDVSGVSLVERIRRIVKGETMPRLTLVQVSALAVALTALGGSAPHLMGAALQQTRAANEQKARAAGSADSATSSSTAAGQSPLAYGWTTRSGESPVSLSSVESTAAHVFERVRVRNISESPIVSLTFLTLVEFLPFDRPVVMVESEPVPVSLAPGEAVDLGLHLLSAAEALELKRNGKPQAWLAVLSARHADGTDWRFTPRRDARSSEEALYAKGESFVSRSLIKPSPPLTPAVVYHCLDDRGYEYSFGALVPILGESHFARCDGGVWVDAGTLGIPISDTEKGTEGQSVALGQD